MINKPSGFVSIANWSIWCSVNKNHPREDSKIIIIASVHIFPQPINQTTIR